MRTVDGTEFPITFESRVRECLQHFSTRGFVLSALVVAWGARVRRKVDSNPLQETTQKIVTPTPLATFSNGSPLRITY